MAAIGYTILIIFIISVFYFFKDRDRMLTTEVDINGGMKVKYSVLVNELLKDPSAKISVIERDRIIINMKTNNTYTEFWVTEYFDSFDVYWTANLGYLGKHSHKFTYPKFTSQHKVVSDIKRFMQDKYAQLHL